MQIHRTFVVKKSDSTGILGLAPSWMPVADPVHSVAHDMLEHFLDPRLNSIESEFKAMGAHLALRVASGTYPEPARAFGNTLSSVFQDAWMGYEDDSGELREHEHVRTFSSRPLSSEHEWAETTLNQAFGIAQEVFLKNLYEVEGEPPRAFIRTMMPSAVSLVRQGYRQSLRRFAGQDLHTIATCLFKHVDDSSTRFCEEYLESESLLPGEKVSVSVDLNRFYVTYRHGKTYL